MTSLQICLMISGGNFRSPPTFGFKNAIDNELRYLLERGFVQESKAYYQLAQRICENSPNRDTEDVSLTLRMVHNNQTTAAAETNARGDCLDHSLIWMRMFQERKTPEGKPQRDYELAIVYNETGVAYGMNEQWSLAEDYFLKSIEVMKEQEEYDDTMLGWPEPNLGLIYWIQGRYDEAETVLNEILDIFALAFGVDDTKSFKYVCFLMPFDPVVLC
jgi:tetratricopeptide (TPR) repeat protein